MRSEPQFPFHSLNCELTLSTRTSSERPSGRSVELAEETNGRHRACLLLVWPSQLVSFHLMDTIRHTRLTYAVGAYFQQVKDQDAMLAILEQTQQDHARPTEGVIENMLKAWGRFSLLVRPNRNIRINLVLTALTQTERQAQKKRDRGR